MRPFTAGACKPGFEGVVHEGKNYCFAKSDEHADIGEGPGLCHPCISHVRNDLTQGHVHIEDGWIVDDSGWSRDVYCRRTKDRTTFPAGDYGEFGWKYFGDCPPLAAHATTCPSPGPTPPPIPPSPPPAGAECVLPIVKLGLGAFGVNGDKHNYQTTFRFGTGAGQNGKPCDGGHLACEDPNYSGSGQCEPCHGLVCEDSRGGQWSAGGGTELVSVSGGEGDLSGCPNCGFHATVKGVGGWVKVCPPPNPRARNAGEPLAVAGNACQSETVK